MEKITIRQEIFHQLLDSVINVVDPKSKSYSPIPCAAWVKDLEISPVELSNWLADSISGPENPHSIYAGVGATGDMYIVSLYEWEEEGA